MILKGDSINEYYNCDIFLCKLLGGLAPIVKLVDRETLLKERQQKIEVTYYSCFNFVNSMLRLLPIDRRV